MHTAHRCCHRALPRPVTGAAVGLIVVALAVFTAPSAQAADVPSPISAIDSSPTTGASDGATNYTGQGYAIAVFDSGVDKNHAALQGKVIDEICVGYIQPFTNALGEQVTSLCPAGATLVKQEGNIGIYRGPGAASDCTPRFGADRVTEDVCRHGTAVAGAAVMPSQGLTMPDSTDTQTTSGSAPGASIIAVQIHSLVPATDKAAAHLAIEPDIALTALNYLAENSGSFSLPVAAMNYSISGGLASADAASCRANNNEPVVRGPQYDQYRAVFAALKAAGIAPVVANGNLGDPATPTPDIDTIAFPACVEGVIAVGATNNAGTAMAAYSQNAKATALLAPGGVEPEGSAGSIWSPRANSPESFVGLVGTSLASPMVAGAFAVLRQKHPDATVDQLWHLLGVTAKPVTDTRNGYTVGIKPLIQLGAALKQDINAIDLAGHFDPSDTFDANVDGARLAFVLDQGYPVGADPQVSVDGTTLTAPEHYTLRKTDATLEFDPTYLTGLAAGRHTLVITFADGANLTVEFTVVALAIHAELVAVDPVPLFETSGQVADVSPLLGLMGWILVGSGLIGLALARRRGGRQYD